METKIVPSHGHYDVYINGDLYCSADNLTEAKEEIYAYEAESEVRENENLQCISCI